MEASFWSTSLLYFFIIFVISFESWIVCYKRIRQWWSIFNTHLLQTLQWCVRGGLGAMHFLHIETISGILWKKVNNKIRFIVIVLIQGAYGKPFFLLLLGKSLVVQQFWTPNSWKLLVLVWLFNHLLEPLSTKFPQQKRESNSNTNNSYCWRA